jgi:5-methylcytosine-specific restriction enzyme subunit McrC
VTVPLRQLTLTEYSPKQCVLASDECDAICRLNAQIQIVRSTNGPDCYDLTPSSWIGAIELPNLAIQIRPKIQISNVLFLLSYAMDPKHWRDTGFNFDEQDLLVEAIIPGFVLQLRRALEPGVLQGYMLKEDALATVRGRIRFQDQIDRHFGLLPPIEVRYDEFTEDVEENRLVKAALRALERIRIRSAEMRYRLHHFHPILDRVSLVEYEPRNLPTINYTRLNHRYRPAVELSKLILSSLSYDLKYGSATGAAFLVDMNEVFEKFVWVALREALGLSAWDFPSGGGNNSLFMDVGQKIRLKPDLSWWEGSNCVFVGDVKYKRISVTGIKHPDLYQLLAYTIATELPGGLLIYAAGEDEPAIHEVVSVPKQLEVTSLDLSGSPNQILADIARIALTVKRLKAGGRGFLQTRQLAHSSRL